MPKAYEYAVEVRNPAVLGPEYREILHEHSVGHVYHYLYAMSSLDQQHEKLKYQFTAPFVLLTFPRFHRHLYKEEEDEIGGQYEHHDQTAVYGRV